MNYGPALPTGVEDDILVIFSDVDDSPAGWTDITKYREDAPEGARSAFWKRTSLKTARRCG